MSPAQRLVAALAMICGVLMSAPAGAQSDASPAGHIKSVSGEASIQRGDSVIPATVGAAVQESDVLRTGADGSLGVTFKDSGRISIGPDTEIAVQEFVFVPRSNKMAFVTKMSRGTMQFFSGVISKLAPQKVSVITPSGTIGVRGTRFVVKVGG